MGTKKRVPAHRPVHVSSWRPRGVSKRAQMGPLAHATAWLLWSPIVGSAQVSPPPPTTDGPVEVGLSIHINKVYGIDTVRETYLIDGYLELTWADPRLSERFESVDSEQMLYEDERAVAVMGTTLWWPSIEFMNIIGERDSPHRSLVISRDGAVMYDERFHATFTSDMDFRRYPFDSQRFVVHIESFTYDDTEVVFVRPTVTTADLDAATSGEWRFGADTTFISSATYGAQGSEPEVYSRYNLELSASRLPGYYIWQLILPLLLIIGASWIVFWIGDFSNQLSTTFTLLLTVVAFNFYTSTLLPRLSYNTFIEVVIISGYLSIFLAIVAVVGGNLIHRGGRQSAAQRLMRACRWLFPAGYALCIALVAARFLG